MFAPPRVLLYVLGHSDQLTSNCEGRNCRIFLIRQTRAAARTVCISGFCDSLGSFHFLENSRICCVCKQHLKLEC